jgi:hypothetical protein
MMLVDRAETVDELLKLNNDRVIVKVQVLQKIAQKVQQSERGDRDSGRARERTIAEPEFKALISQIKKEFLRGEEGMNDFKRNTVLYSLMQMRYKDEELLKIAC